jgi:FkbM family methyltransferase
MSVSQIGQDTRVVEFYKGKRNGFFVDIGSADGVFISNTYMLERDYSWSGICVEPIPEQYAKLLMNRPGVVCCDMAVYNESNQTVVFDIANNDILFSGIRENIDCHMDAVNSNRTEISVNTISLNDLLSKYNAPDHIDYLSLDTEGSEYEILKHCNFNKYTFGYIDVEHNHVEPRRSHIRELLLSNGYTYIGENAFDDIYIHSSLVQNGI